MCLIWGFHVKCSSIISPRNLVSDTRMIFSLSILMLIKLFLTFFLLVNNMKFVFFISSESLLVLNKGID